jgi:pimeloyl-ACP methyl ester carboxylesterase
MLNNPVWRQSKVEAQELLKDMLMNTSLDWVLEDIDIAANPPAAERLFEISKKTLLIIGTEDSQPIKETAKVLEAGIENLKKVEIEGTGHLPSLDKPDEFNKSVLEFLLNETLLNI